MPDSSDTFIFFLVVGARLLVPLAIPRYPLPAGIAALVIDAIDQTVFQTFTRMSLGWYQGYDKALDIYYLSIEYLSTMRNWTNLSAFHISRFLYYFRLVGVLLFELLQIRALLLFFPNTFEYFFLFYEAVRLRWNPQRMSQALVIAAAFFIWVFIKVPQEYWIHIAQLDVTDVIKQEVFGVPTDTVWGAIVSQNIPVFIGVVVIVVVLVVALRWYLNTHLPPADWSVSFDADGHGRDVSDEEARVAQQVGAKTLFDAELGEKIALVSLITIIFSRVVPGLQATVLQTALGVALIIVANTTVSEWLVRRGVVWSSALRQFATMAVTNGMLAILFVIVLPLQGGQLDVTATTFILLLITLLITLYDRFRPFYQAREFQTRQLS